MGEGVRGEAHGVVAGQLDHALLGADGAADDVAARVIGQSAEQAIEVGRGDLHGYNHMVVLRVCQGSRAGTGPQLLYLICIFQ